MRGVLTRKQLDGKPGVHQAVRTPEGHKRREVEAFTEEGVGVTIRRLEDFWIRSKSTCGEQRRVESCSGGPTAMRGFRHRPHVRHKATSPRGSDAERVLQ